MHQKTVEAEFLPFHTFLTHPTCTDKDWKGKWLSIGPCKSLTHSVSQVGRCIVWTRTTASTFPPSNTCQIDPFSRWVAQILFGLVFPYYSRELFSCTCVNLDAPAKDGSQLIWGRAVVRAVVDVVAIVVTSEITNKNKVSFSLLPALTEPEISSSASKIVSSFLQTTENKIRLKNGVRSSSTTWASIYIYVRGGHRLVFCVTSLHCSFPFFWEALKNRSHFFCLALPDTPLSKSESWEH